MTDKLDPIQRFWLLIKPDKKEVRNVYVYAIFSGLLALSLPIGVQAIINLIQGGQISTSWIVLIFFVIGGIAFTGLLRVSQLKILEHLQQKVFTRAAFEFAYRTPRIKLEHLSKYYAPELMNRFFDIISIQKGLSKILIDFSTAAIQTIFGLVLLSMYHSFFIAFSLILLVLVYFIFKVTYKKGLDTSLKESKSKYYVAHWLQELARTNISFKLAGVTSLPLDRVNNLTKTYIDERNKHFKVLITQYVLLIVFKVLIAAALLSVGGLLVINQQMNIGQFVAAEIIILLILNSVEKLILSLETIYDLLTSLEKVGEVTDLEIERNDGVKISEHIDNGMSVELVNVDFSYPNRNELVLNKVSVKIEAYESVLITGTVNSGKSTLLYLLSGLYQIHTGYLRFNNIPANNLEPLDLRSVIGDCLMDESLFEGTLMENITMGRKNATYENVQWAVKNIGLEEYIKTLPKGFDTPINSQGKQFSRNIIDKIILVRSIVDKPKLLLIKDTFSSFSKEEGDKIIDFLMSYKKWTIVIVSNDERLKNKVDKIYYLDKGVLTEIKKKK
ncbi:MAG TPA: ATP-binding cassette domain-containing protein [Crocinitomix sp.]|nr:ATP-binding cassette domain-containing protein [Crocinitomix sp.]